MDTPTHLTDGLPPRRALGPATLRRPTLTLLSVILPLTHSSKPGRVPRGTSARVPSIRDVNLPRDQTGLDAVRSLCLAVMDARGRSTSGRGKYGGDSTMNSHAGVMYDNVGISTRRWPFVRMERTLKGRRTTVMAPDGCPTGGTNVS